MQIEESLPAFKATENWIILGSEKFEDNGNVVFFSNSKNKSQKAKKWPTNVCMLGPLTQKFIGICCIKYNHACEIDKHQDLLLLQI